MRLFVSIDVPQSVKLNLAQVYDQLSALHLSLVPLKQLHCTLCFIGEKTETEAKSIENQLSKISFQPFEVNAIGIGAFPSLEEPRVVWLGLESPALNQLANRIAAALAVKERRPFQPHCTLGRVKAPVNLQLLSKYDKKTYGSWLVTSFELKQSLLSGKGAAHLMVRSFSANLTKKLK